MKSLLPIVAAVVVSIFVASTARSQVARDAVGGESFESFLGRFEQGVSRFVNGDATLWKQNASRGDDVTLMGGWGTYEKGWKDVGARYDWAAGRFQASDAAVTVEYVSKGESGDFAYTVTIERSTVKLAGHATPAPMALRVTQLFRKEGGSWRLIHRHADSLMDTTSAESVLQKK